MLRNISRPRTKWPQLLSDNKFAFEMVTLKNGDAIFLTDPSLILINIKGILSVTKKYITNQASIVSFSTSNTVLYYKTNKTICFHKVQALTNTDLLVLSNQDCVHNSILLSYFQKIELYTLQLQLLDLEYWLAIFTQNTIKKRLVVFVLSLSQLFGHSSKHGIEIDICLSHAYIAEILCTTRITITRSLKELKRESLFVNQKQIIVADPISLANKVLKN
nr:ntcA [Erythrocladia irregularis]